MWCSSAVNRNFLSLLAACRTRSNPLDASSRLGVRDAFCWGRFPLARPLPSIPSAAGCPALFGDFAGTVGLSDFPGPFVIGVRPDFPTRPRATATLGGLGISRFPSEVFTYVHGVSDRAGLCNASRYRRSRWGLPLLLTASASRSNCLTRLNTRPARSPVNASTPPLRAAPHDSGPMGVPVPHSYDFCIHYTSPV